MISDYTQSVLRREETFGEYKTQLNLDTIPLRQSRWLSTNIQYVSDFILCDGVKTVATFGNIINCQTFMQSLGANLWPFYAK